MGSGAAALGLDGEVEAEAFGALIGGRDPSSGEVLRSVSGRDRVCSLDLTFSAPKSVSVLFAIGDNETSAVLVDAHEEAVDAALGYLEREACRVRRGHGGRIELQADGFVAAAYRHRMSRAEQPQLHTHVVAANLARGWGNVVFAGSGTVPGVGIPSVLISGRLAAERITGPDRLYRSRAWPR